MTAIVHGMYSQGKIELLQTPQGIRDGRVRVIVIEEDETKPKPDKMQYGKYSSGKFSTEDDFRIAEWCGSNEWDNVDGK